MTKQLRRDGWLSAGDTSGVDDFYGIHTDDGRILVRDTAPWSVLHERIHDGGIVDDRLGRWLVEALTECVAEHLHETDGLPWAPTYEHYRELLEREILPRLGLSGVELAQVVVRSCRPDKYGARGLHADPGLGRAGFRRIWTAIRRGPGDEPDALQGLLRL